MVQIKNSALDTQTILDEWYRLSIKSNCGAFVSFVGTVRDEDNIEGLSFDIYEPILNTWFSKWQEKANRLNAVINMAHSRGDVALHQSSFVCAIYSSNRSVSLDLVAGFVEDFKKSAPIWKYDLKSGRRVYAIERSTMLDGSGILA